ncbi:hypothetical protein GCM10009416_08610 [Craurococcus roseus]|uniref:Uncharacterized protein n=1 Tax=Craurococcus roseus TaxID=77585 RepID=A0ABN1ERR2_9PROT
MACTAPARGFAGTTRLPEFRGGSAPTPPLGGGSPGIRGTETPERDARDGEPAVDRRLIARRQRAILSAHVAVLGDDRAAPELRASARSPSSETAQRAHHRTADPGDG